MEEMSKIKEGEAINAESFPKVRREEKAQHSHWEDDIVDQGKNYSDLKRLKKQYRLKIKRVGKTDRARSWRKQKELNTRLPMESFDTSTSEQKQNSKDRGDQT